ncbi:hypothetical protein [Deinococcus pimensis]|nr:hypothetical protein [Deinococcus pimensis]
MTSSTRSRYAAVELLFTPIPNTIRSRRRCPSHRKNTATSTPGTT